MPNEKVITNLKPIQGKYVKPAVVAAAKAAGAKKPGLASGLTQQAIDVFTLAKEQQKERTAGDAEG